MDRYRIDSHKLIYHVDRVRQWLQGKNIAPLYVEIAPSGTCNHRCSFCALDYMGYKPRFLDTSTLKKAVTNARRCGVKSIMYAGEGEPLLHKDIAGIISHTKETGIDTAITTNGVFLSKELTRACLGHLSWLRVSFNAGSARTYASIHNCKKEDFDRVVENLSYAVRFKKKNKLATTIGMQTLLLPQNQHEIEKTVLLCKKIGVDYMIIKPFSQHPLSNARIDKTFDYGRFSRLETRLQKHASRSFNVIFRSHTMHKLHEDRAYKHCLGMPFWAYIDAAGNVCACSAFLGKKSFIYGNIYKKSFSTIIKSEQYKKIVKHAATKLNTQKCREICRLDEVNRYLWELTHPSEHVNFI